MVRIVKEGVVGLMNDILTDSDGLVTKSHYGHTAMSLRQRN
jgi:hypothetical protein